MSLAGTEKQDDAKAKKEKREKKNKEPLAEGSGGRHHKASEVKFHRPADAPIPSMPATSSANDPTTTADEDELSEGIRRISLEEKPKKKDDPKKVEGHTGADFVDISTLLAQASLGDEKDKAISSPPTLPVTDTHHKASEVKFPTGASTAKPKPSETKPPKVKVKKEDIEKALADTQAMVRTEDIEAVAIHKQGEQVGRIHNNIEKTEGALEEAKEDLHATDSCCFAMWKAFRDALCCCCAPTHAVPHHDQDFVEEHKPPVAFHPANPGVPKTRKEEIAALKEATHHLRVTLEGETAELEDENNELKEVAVLADKTKVKAEDAQKQGKKILKS